MMTPTASTDQINLETIAGIGSKTAANLRDQFGSDENAVNAAYSIPGWMKANIDGIGEKNLQNLRTHAKQTIDTLGDTNTDGVSRDPADTARKAHALENDKRELYDKYYYPVGFTDQNLALWYTGYYQGGSYGRAISRQVWSKDKVNAVTWGYWHESDRTWKLFTTHSWQPHSSITPPVEHPSGAEYLADIVDDNEWAHLTEEGLIFYQRNRNYTLDDYPTSLSGETVIGGDYHDPREYLVDGKLIGVTLDRIAVYWNDGYRGGTVTPVVRTPDGRLYKLRGTRKFQTNDTDLFSGYNSARALVTDLAETERRGMTGSQKGRADGGLWKCNRDGGVQVRDAYADLV